MNREEKACLLKMLESSSRADRIIGGEILDSLRSSWNPFVHIYIRNVMSSVADYWGTSLQFDRIMGGFTKQYDFGLYTTFDEWKTRLFSLDLSHEVYDFK